MNSTTSQMEPGAMNDGQYHRGYQTPLRSPVAARRRRRCGVADSAVPVAISASRLDLGPGVQPHLIAFGRKLDRRQVRLEHVLGHDGRCEVRRDDALLDEGG